MGPAPSSAAPNQELKSLRLYLHYEQGEEVNYCTLKLTLPAKWSRESIDRLKEFFVEHYNAKKEHNQLIAAEFHLEKEGKILRGDEAIADLLNNRDDLYLKPGPSTYKYSNNKQVDVTDANVEAEVELRCKNFGCTMKFKESDNNDEACKYHKEPPTFHDTKKGWQCCKSKMVYDWEDFEKIEPCTIGRHSTADPRSRLVQCPTAEPAATESPEVVDPVPSRNHLSIEEFNKNNPLAATAVSSVMKPRKVEKRVDGKAKCINYGCQREYFVDINNEKSCCHHKSPPVFHDSGKYWSCCPNTVKYDFDEFLKIPGCVVGSHRDVAVE